MPGRDGRSNEEFHRVRRSDSTIATALVKHFFDKRARNKIFEPQALSLQILVFPTTSLQRV